MPWVDLQYVIVVFPDHTHLLTFRKFGRNQFIAKSSFMYANVCLHFAKIENRKVFAKLVLKNNMVHEMYLKKKSR